MKDVNEHQLRLAKQAAASAARSGRGVVTLDDMVGEAYLWLSRNEKKLEAWAEEGRHGDNKIRHACRLHCLRIVDKERRKQSKLMRGDLHYYSPALIVEILPDIFDPEDWFGGAPAPTDKVKGTSRPSEGNNRLAMIMDVYSAFVTLSKDDQYLLTQLYADGGLSTEVVGIALDCSARTVRRRADRAIEKMIERLGGEPPWWNPVGA